MSYGHNKKTNKKQGWNVKEPKVAPDTAPSFRVDLQAPDFDRLLEQKGVNLKVYRTLYCPNVKSVDGGEHEINCPMCNASGFIDLDPICTKGFIQNQEMDRLLDGHDGQHDGNSVFISFPIGIELQYFTKIELVDFTDLYFERIMRKEGTNIDILKYKACRINTVIDKNQLRYFQDQDFKIDANGNLLWLARKPADGVIFSIHYETHVQYRATRAMHVSRFTQYKAQGNPNIEFIKMPEQWMCTKEFLLRRKDINTGTDMIQGPYDDHENTTGEND